MCRIPIDYMWLATYSVMPLDNTMRAISCRQTLNQCQTFGVWGGLQSPFSNQQLFANTSKTLPHKLLQECVPPIGGKDTPAASHP